jgi:hypothetical protein
MKLRVRSPKESMALSDPQAFRRVLGVAYLSRPQYASGIERRLRKICTKLRSRNQISLRQAWLGALYKKQILTAHAPSCTIGWIDGRKGYGLFADESMPAEAFVGVYTGEVRRRSLFSLRDTRYCFRLPDLTTFGPHFLIDAFVAGNHTRFINHSGEPNVEACSAYCDGMMYMILRTTRSIAAGEELVMDYGPLYWRRRSLLVGR